MGGWEEGARQSRLDKSSVARAASPREEGEEEACLGEWVGGWVGGWVEVGFGWDWVGGWVEVGLGGLRWDWVGPPRWVGGWVGGWEI